MPNYGEPGRGPRLAEGMVLAIEPMVNMGKPAVKVLADGWTAVTQDGSLSAHFEHTVAVTDDGPLDPDALRRRRPVRGELDAGLRCRDAERESRASRRADGRRRSCRARCRSALYRVEIDGPRQMTAHAPSGPGRNFIRVLVGDRVRAGS